MKKIRTYLGVLLICLSCEEHIPTTQHLSVIVDLTDVQNNPPNANDVLSYVSKCHPSDGLAINLRYVSETRYTPKYRFVLQESEVGWLSNEDMQRRKRKKLLQQFTDTLKGNQLQESKRSEIFRLVCDEIISLSEKEGSKQLILFSDLKEHSFFSVYQKRDVANLLYQRDAVKRQFLSKVNLPEDLSGIKLHIVYNPNLEEDTVFTAMLGLYRAVLECRGVELFISNEKKVML